MKHFKHYSELVIVVDSNWTDFQLLEDMSENVLQQRQIVSLLLQLYTILANLELNNHHKLHSDIIKSIVICSSKNDSLLIIPTASEERIEKVEFISLQQFVTQVLQKLLPIALFESLSDVLCEQTISLSQTKNIVSLIAFQTPIDDKDCENQFNYWLDINRCKFVNQYLLSDGTLTQMDYIYLQFLCANEFKSVCDAIALMLNCKSKAFKL